LCLQLFSNGTSLPTGSQTIEWWATTLASYKGLSGSDAIQAMLNTQTQTATVPDQRVVLFTSPEFEHFESVIFTDRLVLARDGWNSAGGKDFYSLPPELQALLFDVTYQHGGAYLQTAGNRLQYAFQMTDWCAAEKFLRALSDGLDRLAARLDLISALKGANYPPCQ
jgi:hypothetical protein